MTTSIFLLWNVKFNSLLSRKGYFDEKLCSSKVKSSFSPIIPSPYSAVITVCQVSSLTTSITMLSSNMQEGWQSRSIKVKGVGGKYSKNMCATSAQAGAQKMISNSFLTVFKVRRRPKIFCRCWRLRLWLVFVNPQTSMETATQIWEKMTLKKQ